jgi:hypothetical protein
MTCPPWTGQLKNEVLMCKNEEKRTIGKEADTVKSR